VKLVTAPAMRIVPESVFDAFAWCASDELEWRRPAGAWDDRTPIDGSDPARMVFVIRADVDPAERARWPRELARLHAFGLELDEEEALAPWAIDAATDGLYARRVRPRDVFWLAADNLNALFWGLHDWAHFHNHGPLVQVAWTELQCDATALAWLWANRARVAIGEATWERVRCQVASLARHRFASERIAMDEEALGAGRLQSLLLAPRISRS
jgi:hypothetical protein